MMMTDLKKSELEKAKESLFGGDFAVSNIKLFPGTNRLATSEDIAGEVNRVLSQLSTDEDKE
ncbi:MAG: hypothetical protein HAW65_07250 [Alphaproteobacteria bacterium]|nr:hypothetical protein [Alphaproteobacteria bacterium]